MENDTREAAREVQPEVIHNGNMATESRPNVEQENTSQPRTKSLMEVTF